MKYIIMILLIYVAAVWISKDTTQMPVLPFSLRAIYQASGDKEHVKEFLYPLVNYFKWWRNTRDAGDGLVTVIHNWESGEF